MGVYIKSMAMPKNCNECPLHFYEGQGICCCRALPAIDDGEILKPWKNKRKDCPLIPVPPHGDLIDMNAQIDVYDRYDDDIIRPTTVRGLINEYISGGYPRIIIPADESDMDSFIRIFEEDDEEDGMDSFIRILKD